MAIVKDGNTNTNTNKDAFGAGNAFADALSKGTVNQQQYQNQTQYTESNNAQAKPTAPLRPSVFDLSSLIQAPMTRLTSGETVQKIVTVIRNLIATAGLGENSTKGDNTFNVLVMDRVTETLPMSSILITQRGRLDGRELITVSVLLVEGSAEKLVPKMITISGRSVEVQQVTGDVFNSHYYAKVENYIRVKTGLPNATIEIAGVMVIPTEILPEDELHLRKVTFSAVSACDTVMESIVPSDRVPFNLGMINPDTDRLTATIEYNGPQAESAVGRPLRSDIRIKLHATQDSGATVTGFDQQLELTELNGFIDLVYSEPAPVPQGMMPITQRYYPRMVITNSYALTNAVTMELQLMALSQMTMAANNMTWAGVFLPRHGHKGVDVKDIGAIGYEVRQSPDPMVPMDRVDTKSADFDKLALWELISTNVHNELIFSMDIEETGESTWLNQTFAASAVSDINQAGPAQQAIRNAANNLTLNKFGEIFPSNDYCEVENNRIVLGYYVDEKGERRDLRDFDYLAMLNLFGKDSSEVVIRWQQTYIGYDTPIEIRLEDRINILKSVLGNSLVITGYAQRINFNPDFLAALEMACRQCNLMIRPANVFQDFGQGAIRGESPLSRFAAKAGQVGALYNSSVNSSWGGYSQRPSMSHFGPSRFGR